MTDDGQTLRQWVGAAVRQHRERHGRRQEDLARVARRVGLSWAGTKVAALERGDKALPAEELVLLPLVLSLAGCGQPSLADLLPDGEGTVALNARTSIPATVVGQLVRGDPAGHAQVTRRLNTEDLDTPEREAAALRAGAIRHAAGYNRLLTVGEMRAVAEGLGEADQRAARELGAVGYPFETLCAVLWGQSLSAKRDALLAATGADETNRASLAARRGRITRELYSQARRLLARADDQKD